MIPEVDVVIVGEQQEADGGFDNVKYVMDARFAWHAERRHHARPRYFRAGRDGGFRQLAADFPPRHSDPIRTG